jgi:hypothetical protein
MEGNAVERCPLMYKSEIIGGEEILDILVMAYMPPFLKPDFTHPDMEELVSRPRTIRISLKDELYQPAVWEKCCSVMISAGTQAFRNSPCLSREIVDLGACDESTIVPSSHEYLASGKEACRTCALPLIRPLCQVITVANSAASFILSLRRFA